jgi:hypothetical protein
VILSGNQALDPAGLAPAIVTDNRKKVTVRTEKTCAPLLNTNPAEGGKYILFCILPGQIDQIPLSIRA